MARKGMQKSDRPAVGAHGNFGEGTLHSKDYQPRYDTSRSRRARRQSSNIFDDWSHSYTISDEKHLPKTVLVKRTAK